MQQQGNQNRATVEHKSQNGHQEHARGIGANLEHRQIHYGMVGREFADDERAKPNNREYTQGADQVGAEPVVLLALVKHDLQACDANRQISHTPEVDLRR